MHTVHMHNLILSSILGGHLKLSGSKYPQTVRVRIMDRLLLVDRSEEDIDNAEILYNGYDSILANVMFLCLQRMSDYKI